MAKVPNPKYQVERVTDDEWLVVAKITIGRFPSQIMAEVVATAIEDLNIPIVSGVRLDAMPPLEPLPLKGRRRKRKAEATTPFVTTGRKPRSDKGKPRAAKKKKGRRGRRS